MTLTDGAPIPCQEIIARGIDTSDIKNSVPRKVRKSAFIPRANGRDNAGLSVTIVRPNVLQFLRERLGAMKEAATLHVGQVREISVAQYRLDVANDPVEGDPYHV